MIEQIQTFAFHHMILVFLAWWFFAQAIYDLPEPRPGSRWYRALYMLLHQIGANVDRIAQARGWTPPGFVLPADALSPALPSAPAVAPASVVSVPAAPQPAPAVTPASPSPNPPAAAGAPGGTQ